MLRVKSVMIGTSRVTYVNSDAPRPKNQDLGQAMTKMKIAWTVVDLVDENVILTKSGNEVAVTWDIVAEYEKHCRDGGSQGQKGRMGARLHGLFLYQLLSEIVDVRRRFGAYPQEFIVWLIMKSGEPGRFLSPVGTMMVTERERESAAAGRIVHDMFARCVNKIVQGKELTDNDPEDGEGEFGD
ncbi:hypothetical protein C8R42DRAFT_642600 [Lentinula raphanica]|nr:hypothetical protein C8R42DRAFT_642600 [Lentinula raphanica]